MNGTDQWHQHNGNRMPPGYPPYYGRPPQRKSKWLAGLLSFLIPGVGHMYVGRMIKAIFIMLMIAGVITGIVQVAIFGDSVLSIVLLSLLLPIIYFYSLFDAIQSADGVNEKLAVAEWQRNAGYPYGHERPGQSHRPVQPMQSHQSYRQHEQHQPRQTQQPPFPELRGFPLKKLALLAIVILLVVFLAQETWSEWKIESTLSIIGAVLLIGAGIVMWAWELRGPHSPQEPMQPPIHQGPQGSSDPER
ncbi:MAG: TM2 domain-containing protein [Cohnella sp.]|nr:TM2 domain-containing protein [Cohnella sp.]